MSASLDFEDDWVVLDLSDPAEPPLYVPSWDDKQIFRFLFRESLFIRRGLSADAAESLGDRLAKRDYERDDRRVCIECSNWQRGNTCAKKQPLLLTQLMRCDFFSFQKP